MEATRLHQSGQKSGKDSKINFKAATQVINRETYCIGTKCLYQLKIPDPIISTQMQNLFKVVIFIFYILSCLASVGQVDICHEAATGKYFPINTTAKRFFGSKEGSYVCYFSGDSLMVGEKVYYIEVCDYGSGKRKETYYREEEGNVYVYDTERKIESLELSGDISPGHSWEKSDKSWKYTVVDTFGSLSTPYCEFKNLLNIRAEPQGAAKKKYSDYYNLYYKRGVGLVGLDVEGKGYSFLGVDKSTVEIRTQVLPECSELESEQDRVNCTSKKIEEFISKNLNFQGKRKKGTIAVIFLITDKGEVENVAIHRSIDNAARQEEEAMRVVKLLKFIPKTTNGKPTKTWVILPFVF